jgi:stage II sporulation protein D
VAVLLPKAYLLFYLGGHVKKILLKTLIASIFVLLLPFILTILLSNSQKSPGSLETMKFVINHKVNEKEEPLDFNKYLIGVVAANMPAGYHIEALKAQAVIARTYALYNMYLLSSEEGHDSQTFTTDELGLSYMELSEMEQFWKAQDYKLYFSKIENAVYDTSNEILIYHDALILPVFFNTGCGLTRNASDAWGVDIPYLKSVDSKQDVTSTDYLKIKEYSVADFIAALEKQYLDINISEDTLHNDVKITKRDSTDYVTEINVGSHTISGEEFAKVLGLGSSHFYIEDYNGMVRIVCNGAGHGIGLSQYGANVMAEENHTYKDILYHYYLGVSLVTMKEHL